MIRGQRTEAASGRIQGQGSRPEQTKTVAEQPWVTTPTSSRLAVVGSGSYGASGTSTCGGFPTPGRRVMAGGAGRSAAHPAGDARQRPRAVVHVADAHIPSGGQRSR